MRAKRRIGPTIRDGVERLRDVLVFTGVDSGAPVGGMNDCWLDRGRLDTGEPTPCYGTDLSTDELESGDRKRIRLAAEGQTSFVAMPELPWFAVDAIWT